MMQLWELMQDVDPKWHLAFVKFVETGEVSEGFVTYLDAHEGCQQSVERALIQQGETVGRFMAALRGSPAETSHDAAARVAGAIKDAMALPDDERARAFRAAAADIKRTLPTDATAALCSALQELGAQRVEVESPVRPPK
jgi:hypothetical protein